MRKDTGQTTTKTWPIIIALWYLLYFICSIFIFNPMGTHGHTSGIEKHILIKLTFHFLALIFALLSNTHEDFHIISTGHTISNSLSKHTIELSSRSRKTKTHRGETGESDKNGSMSMRLTYRTLLLFFASTLGLFGISILWMDSRQTKHTHGLTLSL